MWNEIQRRLISFCSHPRATLAYRTKPFVVPHLQRWHHHRLSREVALDFLSKRPPNAIPHDFSDLWFLYRTVRLKRPRIVLEFGSGCSTVVIAQALYDNNQRHPGQTGYLYSIDDQRYWADVTTATISPSLRTVCEVWTSPTLAIEYKGIPCLRHSNLPDIVPDMIYLDGPTFTTPERKIAIDILDMEEKLRLGFFAIIDGRQENTMFLRNHLRRHFTFRYRIWYNNTVVTLVC